MELYTDDYDSLSIIRAYDVDLNDRIHLDIDDQNTNVQDLFTSIQSLSRQEMYCTIHIKNVLPTIFYFFDVKDYTIL